MRLSEAQKIALRDVANYPGNDRGWLYVWRPKTMAKFADMGLVERGPERYGKPTWRITEAGRKALDGETG